MTAKRNRLVLVGVLGVLLMAVLPLLGDTRAGGQTTRDLECSASGQVVLSDLTGQWELTANGSCIDAGVGGSSPRQVSIRGTGGNEFGLCKRSVSELPLDVTATYVSADGTTHVRAEVWVLTPTLDRFTTPFRVSDQASRDIGAGTVFHRLFFMCGANGQTDARFEWNRLWSV